MDFIEFSFFVSLEPYEKALPEIPPVLPFSKGREPSACKGEKGGF
jgi:hypothetical protein